MKTLPSIFFITAIMCCSQSSMGARSYTFDDMKLDLSPATRVIKKVSDFFRCCKKDDQKNSNLRRRPIAKVKK